MVKHKVKQKIKSSASKRIKVRKSGSLKRRAAFRNHILTKKSSKLMRKLRTPTPSVSKNDEASVVRLLGLKALVKRFKKVRSA
jgi:large subunit ribosomal protein L35